MSAIFGSQWESQFKMVELTEKQRQIDDETFANLLNRVRIDQQTEDDVKMLNAREICQSSPEYPQNVTHIFAENKEVKKTQHEDARESRNSDLHFESSGLKTR